jgi:hypothetical protein
VNQSVIGKTYDHGQWTNKLNLMFTLFDSEALNQNCNSKNEEKESLSPRTKKIFRRQNPTTSEIETIQKNHTTKSVSQKIITSQPHSKEIHPTSSSDDDDADYARKHTKQTGG